MRYILNTALPFFLSVAILCPSALAINYSNSLFAVPGAVDVRFAELHGTEQLYYSLNAQYPARKIIDKIKAQLNALGWTPLEDSFLNPGIPTSHVSGWCNFEDATGKRLQVVHSWWGDWTNNRGEIVTYILRYAYPKNNQPQLESFDVTAIYMSKEAVEEYISLKPLMKKEQERIEKQEAEKLNKKVERIRRQSKQIGEVTLHLVKPQESSNENEVQLDSSIPPLLLEVVFADVKTGYGDYPSIEIVFTAESAEKIYQFSRKHLKRNIAIIVSGEVVSSPFMIEPIEDIAMITGTFTPEKAQEIARKIMSK